MLSALATVLGFFSKVYAFLNYRKIKNVGSLESEVKRLREESERVAKRKSKDAEVAALDRVSLTKRLRRFTRKDRS